MKKRVRKFKGGWGINKNNLLERDTPAKTRRSTALHEAAHAVVAHFFGERVLETLIDPINPGLGRTAVSYKVRFNEIDPVARASVALAGHEAECRVYKRPINQLPREDYMIVLKLGMSEMGIAVVAHSTKRWVKSLLPEIRKVQKALLKAGKLNRNQFLRALKG